MRTNTIRKARGMLLGIAVAMICSFQGGEPTFAATNFTDVKPEYWGAAYIQFAAEQEIINGYPQPDGTAIFAPENQVSMEEAATMLYRALKAAGAEQGGKEISKLAETYKLLFEEHLIAEWARPYVAYGLANEIINQEELSMFTDEAGHGLPAPRIIAAVWTAKALGMNDIGVYGISYKDGADIPQEVLPQIAFLNRMGIMQGSTQTDGSLAFLPDSGIKRSEFAAISNRVYETAQEKSYDPSKEVVSYRGTVLSVDRENRKIHISAANTAVEQIVLINPKAQIIYGGTVAGDGLTSIAAGQSIIIASMSTSLGEEIQAQIWPSSSAQDGTVVEIKHITSGIAKIVICDSQDTPIYYLKTESTVCDRLIRVGDEIRFIADGVKLIEII